MKDTLKLMIATKVAEMIGIICEGVGSLYGVHINIKSKIDIEVKPVLKKQGIK